MNELRYKIINEGKVTGKIIKIDHFINHQIDTKLLDNIGKDIANRFPKATKVLTIETSGIAFATSTARHLNYSPVVFAKKNTSKITTENSYISKVHSFTKDTDFTIRVDKNYIKESDTVLIIDDFLATGEACLGLIDICKQAKADIVGIGIVVEKGFQEGRKVLENKGIDVYSCAIIESISNGKINMK